MPRDRAFIVRLDGHPELSTNALTLDEAAVAEQVSGVPWTMMNPLASAKVAKALLVLVLRRSLIAQGRPEPDAEGEALKVASSLPLEKLHGAFTFDPGTRARHADADADEGEALPPS